MSSTREIFTNPLECGKTNSSMNQRGMLDSSIASAVCINATTFQEFLSRLTSAESNEERLTMLEQEKTKFLFTSAQLITLMEITPSVKTRLNIIAMIGPRLSDPRAKVTELMGMFRYSEEKERVQEVLKARTQVLASLLYKPSGLSAAIVGTSTTTTDGSPPSSAVKSAAPAFEIKGLAAGARPRTTTQNTTTKPRSSSNASPGSIESMGTTAIATATSTMAKPSHSNQQQPNPAPSSSQKVPVDRDRGLSSTEVQQLSQSIRSKGKVKAMIQAFSKGTGASVGTVLDDDNSPTISSGNNSQTNSQRNSLSGTPQDSPRNDDDSPNVKNTSSRYPTDGKISSTGYAPPPPSSLSPSRGSTGTSNKTTTTTTTITAGGGAGPTAGSTKKSIVPDIPWSPPTTAAAAAEGITKPITARNHNYFSNNNEPPQPHSANNNNDNNDDNDDENATSSQSTIKNGRTRTIERSPSDDRSGFGGNHPPHTRTPLTNQNKAWSFFGMDFSCMSFSFMNGDNDNSSTGEDNNDQQETSSDIAAEESRCTY